MIGILVPSAVDANVVTGVSSMPVAIFPIVFAVHGAINNKSALPVLSPHNSICSTSPVSPEITFLPIAYCSASWCMTF